MRLELVQAGGVSGGGLISFEQYLPCERAEDREYFLSLEPFLKLELK
jgi:hypothetical protein